MGIPVCLRVCFILKKSHYNIRLDYIISVQESAKDYIYIHVCLFVCSTPCKQARQLWKSHYRKVSNADSTWILEWTNSIPSNLLHLLGHHEKCSVSPATWPGFEPRSSEYRSDTRTTELLLNPYQPPLSLAQSLASDGQRVWVVQDQRS